MNKRSWECIVAACLLMIGATGFAQNGAPPVANPDNATTDENTPVTINVVANDTDDDNDIDMSLVDLDVVSDGIQNSVDTSQGSYVVDDNGVVTFTPTTDYFGPAEVEYTITDSAGNTSAEAPIHVDIARRNKPPHAGDDSGTTTSDTDLEIDVVANDSDPDGTIDTSKVDLNINLPGIQKKFDGPEGSWSVNKGVVKFKSAQNFSGTATLSYQVYDNDNAASNVATITITVTVTNIAPVAANDHGGTTVNKATTVNVVTNDTDSDGTIDATTVDLNTTTAGIQNTAATSQGSFSVDATGVVTFTPLALFLGTAQINYTVNDDKGATSNIATLAIDVLAINFPPLANNDNATTNKNVAVPIKVTQNDSDVDGSINVTTVDLDPNQAGIQNTSTTAQGTYVADLQGTVTYTPATNFTGVAAQQYVVSDNNNAVSNTATISITVQNVNAAPVAGDDTGATSANTAVNVNVVANDTDSDGVIDAAKVDMNVILPGVQTAIVTLQGTYSVNNIGIVTYTPTPGFTGAAQTTYTVMDNNGAVSNTAKITIAVQPQNAPIANADTGTTKMNTSVDVNVVANDTDSDGSIDVTSVDLNVAVAGNQKTAASPQGNYAVNNTGVVTYVPTAGFSGTATLSYTVQDNKGVVSNAAKITITVTQSNAPVANEDRISTITNKTVTINVLANDTDDGATIDAKSVDLNVATDGIQSTNSTNGGAFSVDAAGVVTFTPATGYNGLASIQYTVKNTDGIVSNAAVINVTIDVSNANSPVISRFETDTLEYIPQNPERITDLLEVTDTDDQNLAAAEISFDLDNYSSGNDKLFYTDKSNITGTFNSRNGLLLLSGTATIADYVNAIKSVQYKFTGPDEFRAVIKHIYIRVSDGKGYSDKADRIIRINSMLRELDIPTAFTPNNDGANDTWRILSPTDMPSSDLASAEVRVYDKKGTLVFDTVGLDKFWDGTFHGKQLPMDSYYYTIDLKQQQKRYKGTVAILR